jgi:hypothetical protein
VCFEIFTFWQIHTFDVVEKSSGLEEGRSPNSVPCFLFHPQGSGDPATLPKAGVTTTISTQKEKEREKEHEVDF